MISGHGWPITIYARKTKTKHARDKRDISEMKTSSKIAIAAAAVGAWLIAKKKGIAGVGVVSDVYTFSQCIRDGILNNSIEKIIIQDSNRPGYDLISVFDPFIGWFSFWMRNVDFRMLVQWANLKRIDIIDHSINGCDGVQKIAYDDYVVSTKDGKHAVEFQWMSDGDVSVSAWYKGDGSNPQFDWDFWNHIGFYKTLAGAKRGAKKFMAERGYELKEKDLNKIK